MFKKFGMGAVLAVLASSASAAIDVSAVETQLTTDAVTAVTTIGGAWLLVMIAMGVYKVLKGPASGA